eukprot:2733752-Amphidinium_carterae.2
MADADEASKAMLAHDFEATKSYLELGLRLKFDCFQRLPWHLAALAHDNSSVRQGAAQRCIQLYDDSLVLGFENTQHHGLTLDFLTGLGGLNLPL